MANEISVSVSLSASKGGATLSLQGTKTLDMAGEDMIQCTQIVTTSAEALAFGDITGVPAYLGIKNLDDTNAINISLVSDGTTPFAILKAGQVMVLPPGASTIYGKAAGVNVHILLAAMEA